MGAGTESARRPGRPGAATPAVPEQESILRRGLEAFAELGYDRTSARELARRLGVSHNFINDRYGSKAAFWRAVVDSELSVALARLPEVDPALDDAENLRKSITAFYLAAADEPLMARLLVDELNQDTERLDHLFAQYMVPALETMRFSIERLVDAGRMAPVPLHVLFFAVIPPLSGVVDLPLARRLGRPEPALPEQLTVTAESLAALVVNGLLATGSVARA